MAIFLVASERITVQPKKKKKKKKKPSLRQPSLRQTSLRQPSLRQPSRCRMNKALSLGGDPFKITWINKLPCSRRGIHIWVTSNFLDQLVHSMHSEGPDRYSTNTKNLAFTRGGDPFKITCIHKLSITRRGIHIWVTGHFFWTNWSIQLIVRDQTDIQTRVR